MPGSSSFGFSSLTGGRNRNCESVMLRFSASLCTTRTLMISPAAVSSSNSRSDLLMIPTGPPRFTRTSNMPIASTTPVN